MDSFVIGVQLLLAGVFAVAGVAKLFDLSGSRQAVKDFGVPEGLAPTVAVLLPLVELATAVALVIQPTARWGGVAALALFLGFSAGIANAMRQGKDVDCGCFGRVYSAVAGSRTLIRNLVLAALAAVLVIHGPGPAINDWIGARSAAELVAIGSAVAAALLAAFSLDMWSKNRKLRRDLAAAPAVPEGPEPRLPEGEREGLPVGSKAPDFALRDLHGETRTLESFRRAGRPVLLEFVDPGCSACDRLWPALVRWQFALGDRVTVAVITQGSAESKSEYEEMGISNVMFDESNEAFDSFRVRSTPTAIAVDADGTVASAPAGGTHMPEVLVRLLIERQAADSSVASPASTVAPPVEPSSS